MKMMEFQFSKDVNADNKKLAHSKPSDENDSEPMRNAISNETYNISLSEAEAFYEAFYKNTVTQNND